MCSDVPPLEVVVIHMEQKKLFGIAKNLSHMDREESVPLDGAWNMHEESPWLSGGQARDACAWCGRHGAPIPTSVLCVNPTTGAARSSLVGDTAPRASPARYRRVSCLLYVFFVDDEV